MSRHFIPRMDILPEAQKRLWPELKPAQSMGFVLYGGTAIALRLGHRTSVDFDFFNDQPLDKNNIHAVFSFMRYATVIQDETETLTVLVKETARQDEFVKISFFGGIRLGRVSEPEHTEDDILEVASLEDLIAHKLKVILQRIEAKDYLDIAALLKASVSLEKGLAAAKALYGSAFQPSESLKAMVYFEGGDLDTLPLHVKKTLVSAASRVQTLPSVTVISSKLSLNLNEV